MTPLVLSVTGPRWAVAFLLVAVSAWLVRRWCHVCWTMDADLCLEWESLDMPAAADRAANRIPARFRARYLAEARARAERGAR